MPKNNDAWGIEVGSNAIKAIRLMKQGGEVSVADYEIIPFKRVLSTPDLNVEEAIRVGLDQLTAKHEINKSATVVSVPGNQAFARFAKLPPVDPKKVNDIVQFEAVQQIPFPINEVVWDYQVFQQEDSPDVEVGIFAMTNDRVASALNNYRSVGMRVDGITLSPLALYNAFQYDRDLDEDSQGLIIVDIGTMSTDVIIIEQGKIWLRTVPIGGNNFTQALMQSFKLSYNKAEKLKREARTSKYSRQIFQAMRPVFNDLVQELQRSLGYYQSLNREADLKTMIGVGSTFRLPALSKYLKQQLQVEVIRPDSFEKISVDGKQEADWAEHALNLGPAYGLALQGLGMEDVTANLLPRHIISERMWRSKQPWFAAAALIFLAVTVLAGVRFYGAQQAAATAEVQQKEQLTTSIINRANQLQRQWQELERGSDPRLRVDNLRRVLDYRDVWPKIMEDVSLAAASLGPQPATLSTNYEELKTIPRQQRRRVYIDQLSVNYVVGAAANTPGRSAAPSQATRSYSDSELWGERRAVDIDRQGPSQPSPSPSPSPGSAGSTGSTVPPSFVIEISGTTPHAEGARFLSENFIKWLQENAKRKDRPYVIEASDRSLVEVERVRDSARGERADTPTGSSLAATSLRRRGTGRTTTDAPSLKGALSYLPERPTTDEPRATDRRFVVRWTVRLLRPEAARQAEQAESDRRQPAGVAPDESPTQNAKGVEL